MDVDYPCPDDWKQWMHWLSAGLHGRNRWWLPILLMGILMASGRRTVTAWLRAAGISTDYPAYYHFLTPIGRRTWIIAERLLVLLLQHLPLGERVLAALDDTPTKRAGPCVQGAGIHHNPTPGPADQKFLYGHVWVVLSLVVRHALWGTIGLPLLALLYVRAKDMAEITEQFGWTFATKLELGAKAVTWLAELLRKANKRLWVVADGAYAKSPFLRPLIKAGVVVISRLRKDAALFELPAVPKKGAKRGRGQPRKYGKNRSSLAKRAAHPQGWQTIECVVYGKRVTKTFKTFLATYEPVRGVIRVVIVREEDGCEYFFATDPTATVRAIIEAFADRATIEQDFHDLKEIWGAGQQQVRNLWRNLAVFHLNLWMKTLVELWSWHQPAAELIDRSDSPWDDPARRPSHADRRRALQKACIVREFSRLLLPDPIRAKIRSLLQRIARIAA